MTVTRSDRNLTTSTLPVHAIGACPPRAGRLGCALVRTLELPIKTDRLVLRPHREEDAPDLLRFSSRPDVARYLLVGPWTAEDAAREVAKRIPRTGLETDARGLALVLEHDGVVIGDIALWHPDDDTRLAEIGWTLDPDYGGRGFASEAAQAVLSAAFDVYGLHRVAAQMDARNSASARLAERVGMRREAHLRSNWWCKGEWTDTLIYARLADDPPPR